MTDIFFQGFIAVLFAWVIYCFYRVVKTLRDDDDLSADRPTPSPPLPLEYATNDELVDELRRRSTNLVVIMLPLTDDERGTCWRKGNAHWISGVCKTISLKTAKEAADE